MYCICENEHSKLNNIHCNQENVTIELFSASDGYGMIVNIEGRLVAVFDISYCPKCGINLDKLKIGVE